MWAGPAVLCACTHYNITKVQCLYQFLSCCGGTRKGNVKFEAWKFQYKTREENHLQASKLWKANLNLQFTGEFKTSHIYLLSIMSTKTIVCAIAALVFIMISPTDAFVAPPPNCTTFRWMLSGVEALSVYSVSSCITLTHTHTYIYNLLIIVTIMYYISV